MSTRHRKTNGTQEGLSSKKSPETQQKEAQHTPFDVMLGFSSLQRFSAGKTMLCLQEALSHFAKWCKNALCRKIPHPKAYRIRSAVLCFLMCFFAMQKHSKKQDAPFSRPFGATENDAQKLHALWLLPMIVVCNTAHEVSCREKGFHCSHYLRF